MLEDFVIAIRLIGVKPRVSRQVQVSGELGLRRFHQVVQAVMGWEDTGLHLWRGPYDDFGDLRQFVPPGPEDERKATVADLFNMVGDTATYVYDFDAKWTHELLLVDFAEPKRFPILLDGTGACPPEGIGGAHVYEEFKRDEYAPPPLMKRMVASGRLGLDGTQLTAMGGPALKIRQRMAHNGTAVATMASRSAASPVSTS